MAPSDLASVVATEAPHVEVTTTDTPRAAISHLATTGSPIVVAGSLYLAGAVRADVS
jgi:folylpolyglutamate synthase/dihydropteroate synthase